MGERRYTLILDGADMKVFRKMLEEMRSGKFDYLQKVNADYIEHFLDEAEGITREPGIKLAIAADDGRPVFVWDGGRAR